jgi:hypothetical protein
MAQDPSQIEELKKTLYSRNAPLIRTKRRLRFEKPQTEGVQTDWEHPPENEESPELNKYYQDHSMSFLKKLFIASLLFFIFAVGIGAYLVFNGSMIVSANNIDITVSGPVSVAGGTPVSFEIQVVNKNNIKLQNVDFLVEFPAGTVDPEDTTKELKQFREFIGEIEPGAVAQKTVKAVMYGQENSKKEIVVTTSYQVKGSNAIVPKQKTFDILLSSSPLALTVNSFEEITSGQLFDMKVTLASNSKETLKNLVLKANYPFGYNFVSSDVQTGGDSSTWKIGDIPPGGKKVITIKGRLDGEDDETRAFRFMAGTLSQNGQNVVPTIGTQFISESREISIRKPFVSVGISLDDTVGGKEYVGGFNDSIKVEVSWFNNLPTAISDGEIHLKLTGNSFDKFSVSPEQGLYQSANNTITWNKITTPELGTIGAGESGKVVFNLTPRDLSTSFRGVSNPSISLTADVGGRRVSESNVPEQISSSAARNIKISSNASLSSQIVRSIGGIANTGPIPPRAEQTTTYTVLWTVDNTANTLSGAEVHASLPAYVTWLGKTSPSDEDISFNKSSGNIVWKVGSVDTYTVGNKKRRQVAFQISFTPSVAQIGQSPNLVDQSVLNAHDDFTEQTLTSSNSPMNTRFSSDPAFKDGDEIVGR